MSGFVYIMSNKPFGVLYVGATANIAERVLAHREGRGATFCLKWGLNRLVLIELYPTIEEAITREKALKNWNRAWKTRLTSEANPQWNDLFDTLNG